MFLKKLLSSFHCFYFLYLFICNYLSLSILMWVTWKARTFQFVFIPYPCENPGWKSVTAKDASLPVVTVVLFSWLTHSPCLSWGIIAERIHLSCCHSWLIPLLVPWSKPQDGWSCVLDLALHFLNWEADLLFQMRKVFQKSCM